MIEQLFLTTTIDETHTGIAAGALEDITDPIVLNGIHHRISVVVTNTGAANAFQDFALLVQPSYGAAWFTLISAGGWAAGLANVLIAMTTDPRTLAALGTTYLQLNVGAVYAIKFQAQAAANTTNSTVIGTAAKGGLV